MKTLVALAEFLPIFAASTTGAELSLFLWVLISVRITPF